MVTIKPKQHNYDQHQKVSVLSFRGALTMAKIKDNVRLIVHFRARYVFMAKSSISSWCIMWLASCKVEHNVCRDMETLNLSWWHCNETNFIQLDNFTIYVECVLYSVQESYLFQLLLKAEKWDPPSMLMCADNSRLRQSYKTPKKGGRESLGISQIMTITSRALVAGNSKGNKIYWITL